MAGRLTPPPAARGPAGDLAAAGRTDTGPARVGTRATWIVAYDIRDPRRLKKVHARTVADGLRLQYSLYAADLTERERARLRADIAGLIDPGVDDVRFYRVPEPPRGLWLGPKPMTDDLLLLGAPAARLVERLARQKP
jgi:CRISPR-associated protein Cas2